MPPSANRVEFTVEGGRLELDKKLVRQVLRAAGNEIASIARNLVRKSAGSGRLYALKGSQGQGKYRASAPGMPPVSVSGKLASAIRVTVRRDGESVGIRDNAFYAKFLEAGAQGGGFGAGKRIGAHHKGAYRYTKPGRGMRVVLPRPFLSRALEIEAPTLGPRIKTAVNDGLKFVRLKRKP